MLKQKIITRPWFALALLASLVLIPSTLAQGNGKIYQFSYSPAEPLVLESAELSMDIENPTGQSQSYYLALQIILDGKPVDEKDFTLSVDKNRRTHITSSYMPETIGVHQAIIRLYDKLKINLYDTKIITFNVLSQIGPFDIILDPLSSRIRPGLRLPAKLVLENMGTKGTDAEIRIAVNCDDKPIAQSITVFVPGRGRTERLVSSDVCAREGLYEISASIMMFNKTLASSTSYFFVNSSFVQLQLGAPENVTVQPGQSITFPVEVKNAGNQKIRELKFVIERIPLEWQGTSPESVTNLDVLETAIFLVNITVPADAQQNSYEIRMTAAGEETIEKKTSFLNVAQLSTPTTIAPSATTALPFVPILLLAVLTLTGILLKTRAKQQAFRYERRPSLVEELKKQVHFRYERRPSLVEELKKQVHGKRKFR